MAIIDFLKKQNIWVIGLVGEAKTSYDKADLTGPLALVVGNEGKGISPDDGQKLTLNIAVYALTH